MIASSAERFLTTDERRVGLAVREVVGAAVHQVPKELPPCGNLEASQPFFLGDEVKGAGSRHRAGATLEAAGLAELRDAVGVCDDDRQRVRRRDEELRAKDHVPVGIAISARSEARDWIRGRDLLALGVEAHPLDKLNSVGQVRVRVPMPCRIWATEIWLGFRVDAGAGLAAQHLLQDFLRIWALHARHRVIDKAELRPRNELLDLAKVKTFLEEAHVVLHRVKYLNDLAADGVARWLGEVNVGDTLAHLDLGDACCLLHHFVCHLLRCRPTILAIVLDAEILSDAAWVVGSRADEATERFKATAA
mmetsp:Transcript_23311/g.57974  ORF Transcript_23311/g.57974 Transcript_23311/m.57974 type:complete len:306 (-) Transcript_23311:1739-2656(-)